MNRMKSVALAALAGLTLKTADPASARPVAVRPVPAVGPVVFAGPVARTVAPARILNAAGLSFRTLRPAAPFRAGLAPAQSLAGHPDAVFKSMGSRAIPSLTVGLSEAAPSEERAGAIPELFQATEQLSGPDGSLSAPETLDHMFTGSRPRSAPISMLGGPATKSHGPTGGSSGRNLPPGGGGGGGSGRTPRDFTTFVPDGIGVLSEQPREIAIHGWLAGSRRAFIYFEWRPHGGQVGRFYADVLGEGKRQMSDQELFGLRVALTRALHARNDMPYSLRLYDEFLYGLDRHLSGAPGSPPIDSKRRGRRPLPKSGDKPGAPPSAAAQAPFESVDQVTDPDLQALEQELESEGLGVTSVRKSPIGFIILSFPKHDEKAWARTTEHLWSHPKWQTLIRAGNISLSVSGGPFEGLL